MRGESGAGVADLAGDIDDGFLWQTAFLCGKGWRVLGVEINQHFDEAVKGLGFARVFGCQEFLPVNPATHVCVVVELLQEDNARHCQ